MDGAKLTGLWKGETKDGRPYLAGNISPTARLLILQNDRKETDREPDYHAFIVPVEKRGGESKPPQAGSPKQEENDDFPF